MDRDNKIDNEKVKIYIIVEPLGLKFGAVFKRSETFQAPVNFIQNQIKKLGIKFNLGRIIENKTDAIILTDFLLGDFLENNDQITILSEEYGFIKKNLPGDNEHSSSKKNFYLKSVSDLYKTKNFLKKKRKEKEKQNQKKENNFQKKKEEKEENDEESENEKDNEKDEKSKSNLINKKSKKDNDTEKEKIKENKSENIKDKNVKKIQKKSQKNLDKNPKSPNKSSKKKHELSSESEEEKVE